MPGVSTDKKGTKRAMKIEMQYGKNITTHRELMLATALYSIDFAETSVTLLMS